MNLEDRARRAADDLRRRPVGKPPPIAVVRRRKVRRRVVSSGVVVMVLVIGLVGWAAWPSGSDETGVVAGPASDDGVEPPPGTTVPPGTAPPPTLVASPTTTPPASGDTRPDRYVAVRSDGTLVFVGQDGSVTELANRGDPRQQPAEGGPYYISAIGLDQRRRQVFYEACCEPAGGNLRRVGLDGRGDAYVDDGYYPTVSPDGRWLAFSTYIGLDVVDLVAGSARNVDGGEDYAAGSMRVAWSPDGRTLALEETSWPMGRSRILVLDRDATSLEEARVLEPPDGADWTLPAFRADGSLLVAEQCCWPEPRGPARGVVLDVGTGEQLTSFAYEGAVLDQGYDDTGTWLLYVTADQRLRWRGGGDAGMLGEGYRNADW